MKINVVKMDVGLGMVNPCTDPGMIIISIYFSSFLEVCNKEKRSQVKGWLALFSWFYHRWVKRNTYCSNDHAYCEQVNLCPQYANRSNAGVDVCATCPFNFFDESVKEGNGRWMERPMGEIVTKSIGMVDSFALKFVTK